MIRENLLTGLAIKGTFESGNPEIEKLNIAVRNDWPILQSILLKAMANVSDKEMKALENKWVLQAPVATDEKKIQLTQAEKSWLAKNPVWKVGNELDWPPFDYAEDGVPKGYAIDLVNLALKKIGAEVEWINGYSWSELIDLFKKGEIHILPTLYKNEERKKYIYFTYSYATNPSVLVTHTDSKLYKSLKDLKGRKIALMSGDATARIIARQYPEIEQVPLKNIKEGLQAVSDKNVEAFVGSIGTVSYILDHNYIPNVKVIGETGLLKPKDTALHMGVLKGWEIQGRILQKGLSAISKTEFDKIEKKWLPLIQYRKERQRKVALSLKETDWLVNHPEFIMGDDFAWPPFSFLNEKGAFSGIASGYLNLIADRLGLTFNPIYGLSWSEVLERTKDKSIDILPAVAFSEERASYMDFTKPYFKTPIVIATLKGGEFVDNLKGLSGKRVGIIEGYLTQEFRRLNCKKLMLLWIIWLP
jgi:ABC-type amino acid transport substrate-binding protein